MNSYSYPRNQMEKISFKAPLGADVQFRSGRYATDRIGLNESSAQDIVNWLYDRFGVTAKVNIPEDGKPLPEEPKTDLARKLISLTEQTIQLGLEIKGRLELKEIKGIVNHHLSTVITIDTAVDCWKVSEYFKDKYKF